MIQTVIHKFIFLFCVVCFTSTVLAQNSQKINPADNFLSPSSVVINGILGGSISLAENGRLRTLPEWNNGQLIKMFSAEERKKNATTDWYGEHGGKWLYTAALAVQRTNNEALKTQMFKTADYL